jgi:gas vesicle protein
MAKSNVMIGLLAGAAAGAVAGILLAPGKGSETRKSLSKKGRDTMDNLKGKVNDLVDNVADKYLSGDEYPGNSRRDGDLKRARSTASPIAPGSPSTQSFT